MTYAKKWAVTGYPSERKPKVGLWASGTLSCEPCVSHMFFLATTKYPIVSLELPSNWSNIKNKILIIGIKIIDNNIKGDL